MFPAEPPSLDPKELADEIEGLYRQHPAFFKSHVKAYVRKNNPPLLSMTPLLSTESPLEAKVVFLAMFRDSMLPFKPRILSRAVRCPAKAINNPALRPLIGPSMWTIEATRGSVEKLRLLADCLHDVREHLGAGETAVPTSDARQAGDGKGRKGKRGVSLTCAVIDELLDLVKSVRRALPPVDLPPENQRNQALWRKCLRSQKSQLRMALRKRSTQVTGLPRGSPLPSLASRDDRLEASKRFSERVLQAAEYEYRRRDPATERLTQKRERFLPEKLARLRELFEWHRPALKAEWQRHGYDPKGRLELYEMASSGVRWWSPALDHVLQDFLEIRLRLEQEPASVPGTEKPARGNGHIETSSSDKALSKEAKALAALADHHDWTDKQIAKAAGCNVKSLYRMRKFKTAKAAIKEGKDDMPKGSKSKEGEVEAWEPGEGPDDGGSLDAQYR